MPKREELATRLDALQNGLPQLPADEDADFDYRISRRAPKRYCAAPSPTMRPTCVPASKECWLEQG